MYISLYVHYTEGHSGIHRYIYTTQKVIAELTGIYIYTTQKVIAELTGIYTLHRS